MQALFSKPSNGLQSSLQAFIELLPVAAYGISAPDGVVIWYNSRAADLWGRKPVIGDLDERFCGSYRLYMPDGTFMAHNATPMVAALQHGTSLHKQDVIIERPDGSRVTVCVHIDPVRDNEGKIIGVVNFFYDVSERMQRETATKQQAEELDRAVQQQTASLSTLSRRLITLQDEERRRFSRELHDGLGQSLSLAKMSIDALRRKGSSDPTLSNLAEQAQSRIEAALEETRTVSYLFHPPLLDEFGFRAAVISYAEGFTSRSHIDVKVDIPKGLPRFTEHMETALFRIVQESLNNVYRHADASKAMVLVIASENILELEIRDDGKGFDPAKLSGVGIASMRERLRELNGDLAIDSAPGKGTRIIVTLPTRLAAMSASCTD